MQVIALVQPGMSICWLLATMHSTGGWCHMKVRTGHKVGNNRQAALPLSVCASNPHKPMEDPVLQRCHIYDFAFLISYHYRRIAFRCSRFPSFSLLFLLGIISAGFQLLLYNSPSCHFSEKPFDQCFTFISKCISSFPIASFAVLFIRSYDSLVSIYHDQYTINRRVC